MPETRWVLLYAPTSDWERTAIGPDPFVLYEAPRPPFAGVNLAEPQHIGLFALPCLPRLNPDAADA